MDVLEQNAAKLEAMARERSDAIGYKFGQGPNLMQDTNVLAAHTVTTVKSMRTAYEDVRALDARAAEKMNPGSVTERETELHWAHARVEAVRQLSQDNSFDVFQYKILTPRIVVESVKRLLGCGFVYSLTDRQADKAAYRFEPLRTVRGSSHLFGGCRHKPRLKVNKKERRIDRTTDGKWQGIGNTIRADRRADIRRIARATRLFALQEADANSDVLTDEEVRLARLGMKRLRRGLARLKEQVLQS